MLVFSRKVDERIIIANGGIIVTVLGIKEGRVSLGIETTDRSIPVDREEVHIKKLMKEEQNAKGQETISNSPDSRIDGVTN